MNIGFIGLGKLGMPVAVCVSEAGHSVLAYDADPSKMSKTNYPFEEVAKNKNEKFQDMLLRSDVKFAPSLEDVVRNSDLIFVAVQTPHKPLYEGNTRVPDTTSDFSYEALETVLDAVAKATKEPRIVSIISTVAPGTYRSRLSSILSQSPNIHYCYNPYFIAMGTVVTDFLNPEFVLVGGSDELAIETLKKFYATIHNKPTVTMDIASAEIVKMAYNTFITMKIVFANNNMELCDRFGGNVDSVNGALKKATDRLISPKYLTAGMGDGGGCHPRDNIVLSHLARIHGMSCDLGGQMMKAREAQAEWLCNIVETAAFIADLPIIVLGRSFKPETNIETGSPAVLCINILKEKSLDVTSFEPYVDAAIGLTKAVYFIGTRHDVFTTYDFPHGSIIIDPHRFIPKKHGITVKYVGVN